MGIDTGPTNLPDINIGNIHIDGKVKAGSGAASEKPGGANTGSNTAGETPGEAETVDGQFRELAPGELPNVPVIDVTSSLGRLEQRASSKPKSVFTDEEIKKMSELANAAKQEELTGVIQIEARSPQVVEIINRRNRVVEQKMQQVEKMRTFIPKENNGLLHDVVQNDFVVCGVLASLTNPDSNPTGQITAEIPYQNNKNPTATLQLDYTDRTHMSAQVSSGERVLGTYVVTESHYEPSTKTNGIGRGEWPEILRKAVKVLAKNADDYLTPK